MKTRFAGCRAWCCGCAARWPRPPPAQTKWNLPAAYPADNPHTRKPRRRSPRTSRAATGGKLQITVHAGASLFKAPEIKRAVQTGQAQMGEILLSIHENEDPIFGIDVVPFLAIELPRRDEALQGVEGRDREEARRAGHHAAVRGAVGAAGHLRQEGHQHDRRHEGPEVARLQCRHRAHRRTGRRAVGDDPGGRTAAGARDRRGQLVHVVGRHRLRHQGLGDADALLRHAGLDPEELHLRQQGGVRRARQADAGGDPEGRRRRRGARLEDAAGQGAAGISTSSRPRA